jgi:hypothetical protein
VLDGTPITISWTPVEEYSLSIDHYEVAREGNRRPFSYLRMDKSERNLLLKNLGFSVQERRVAARIATIIRRQRQESIAHAYRDAHYERLEKIMRALKNIATLGRRKAKEREYLSKAYQSGVARQKDPLTLVLPGSSARQPRSSMKRHDSA